MCFGFWMWDGRFHPILSFGFKVCGYDPFVRPEITDPNFVYASTYQNIVFRNHDADIAVSITTLDHILEDADRIVALNVIRESLKKDGFFFILEYALDSEEERAKFNLKNSYQSFLTFDKWSTLLKKTGFQVHEISSIPHPLHAPSANYVQYLRFPMVKFCRYALRFGFLSKKRIGVILRWSATRVGRVEGGFKLSDRSSPLKLIKSTAIR